MNTLRVDLHVVRWTNVKHLYRRLFCAKRYDFEGWRTYPRAHEWERVPYQPQRCIHCGCSR